MVYEPQDRGAITDQLVLSASLVIPRRSRAGQHAPAPLPESMGQTRPFEEAVWRTGSVLENAGVVLNAAPFWIPLRSRWYRYTEATTTFKSSRLP